MLVWCRVNPNFFRWVVGVVLKIANPLCTIFLLVPKWDPWQLLRCQLNYGGVEGPGAESFANRKGNAADCLWGDSPRRRLLLRYRIGAIA